MIPRRIIYIVLGIAILAFFYGPVTADVSPLISIRRNSQSRLTPAATENQTLPAAPLSFARRSNQPWLMGW